jgi:hypothetical protein
MIIYRAQWKKLKKIALDISYNFTVLIFCVFSYRKCGSLYVSKPYRTVRLVAGIALPLVR